MIHNYTSNVSREQFELIREDLENARKRTRPRTVDLYEVFCGVLYGVTISKKENCTLRHILDTK